MTPRAWSPQPREQRRPWLRPPTADYARRERSLRSHPSAPAAT